MIDERTCPVCGYDQLRRPPKLCLICPSCGTEFDIDDALYGVEALREHWKTSGPIGPQWFSQITPPPTGWDWRAQLDRVENRSYVSSSNGSREDRGRSIIVNVDLARATARPSSYQIDYVSPAAA